VIAKVGPRYGDASSLIRYVYDAGRTEDDHRPRVVAGWRIPTVLEPPRRLDGRRDFRRLAGLLEQTVAVLGDSGFARPVWHCVMRAAPGDRPLSDDEWAQIASDVMNRTGVSPADQEDDAVRWVAIRRGADRIHIVATLARQDRGKPRLWNDWYQVRDACRAAEERYGLQRTAPADSRAACSPSTREIRRAQDHGLGEAPASRCNATSTPPQEQAANRSSSPSWRRPECSSANDPAPEIPAWSPGTRWPCPATPPATAARCGTAAARSALTCPCPGSASAGSGPASPPATIPAPPRTRSRHPAPFPAPNQSGLRRRAARRAVASGRPGRHPLPGN
jgi:hypothetical protein